MRIDHITNCLKSKVFGNYSDFKESESLRDSLSQNKGAKRYKHYEELSDDVLCARSIIKAHQEVEKSGKMRMFKAIPAISTAIITTSIAITQPGKLAAKAGAGLGFLALSSSVDLMSDLIGNIKAKSKNYSVAHD